jgi:hypothetical protein
VEVITAVIGRLVAELVLNIRRTWSEKLQSPLQRNTTKTKEIMNIIEKYGEPNRRRANLCILTILRPDGALPGLAARRDLPKLLRLERLDVL